MPEATTPANLGEPGTALWVSITEVHTALGPDVMRLLEDACREADVIGRLEDALRDAPLMVTGSQGQLVSSPLVSEVRQHRAVLSGLLKSLKLPVSASAAAQQDQANTDKARQAARARWDRPRLVG